MQEKLQEKSQEKRQEKRLSELRLASRSMSSKFEERVAALVHVSVTNKEVRLNHMQYMMSRLIIGLVTLASLPLYLGVYGKPTPLEALAFLWLLMPLVSTFILSATGREDWTIIVSSLALSAMTVTFGAMYGGVLSPVVIWFAIIPLEALFLASAQMLRFSLIAALAGFLCLAFLDSASLANNTGMAAFSGVLPLLMLGLLAHIGAVGAAMSRKMEQLSNRLTGKIGYEQAVFQAISDVVLGHDINGNVIFASRSCKSLFGLDPHQIKERKLFDRLNVIDRPTFLKAISDAKRLQKPVTVELRLTSGFMEESAQKNDEHPRVLWVEMTAQALKTPHGDCAVVSTMTDITAHKHYEEELEIAKHEAEKASDLKGKFLATVSHELRTPLNAIIGFSEILASPQISGMNDERKLDYAKIIHTSGYHLLEIVNTLLDVSKIDTGNFELNHDSFDFAKLVQESCDVIQIKADQGNVTLIREVDSGLNEMIADRRALKQVLLNLLSNAVKFTSQGGSVSVQVQPIMGGLKIVVKDTGIGIAPEDLPRVGDPFFQVRSTYDRPYEGTGLGISVVKGLVGLHHGQFEIASEVGKGTIVTITLPYDCSQKPARNIVKIAQKAVQTSDDAQHNAETTVANTLINEAPSDKMSPHKKHKKRA